MRFLWRFTKRLLFLLAVVVILFGTMIAYLGVTTPEPRASDVWSRLPDLPHPRGESASAIGARVVDDLCPPGEPCPSSEAQFFVMGGLAGPFASTVDTVDIFDPGLGSWSDGPALPEPRHHAAGAGLGGVVYLSGGSRTSTNWEPTDTFWRLLPIDEQWEDLPPMPEPRMGHQMVAIQQKLYVIGGQGETTNVLIYDTVEETWSLGAEMPTRRDHLAAAVAGLRIYAMGGRGDQLTSAVEIYDTITDSWTDGPDLPMPMSAMAVATLPDGIHVVGGEDPAVIGGTVIDEHLVLRPGGSDWTNAALPIIATHGSASAVLRGSMIIAGGSRRQGALSVLGWTGVFQLYEPNAQPLSPSPSPSPEPTAP